MQYRGAIVKSSPLAPCPDFTIRSPDPARSSPAVPLARAWLPLPLNGRLRPAASLPANPTPAATAPPPPHLGALPPGWPTTRQRLPQAVSITQRS